ncbi:MAG: prepilin-type N-terminal cleavage/methylation domain-containing protein [Nitrospirae bacterium]|nr:prepilin-type N-terminal cleavage/methylation domain-containing protein [Nitrospirota bacterium]
MKPMNQKGFSLVELLMVVAIIGIATAVAIPYLTRYTQNNNLRNAARAISGDFFEYKSKATAEYRLYRMTFSIANNNYTIEQCTATGSTCTAGYANVVTKEISSFGSGITFDGGGTTVTQYIFQTRGTVTNGTLRLINNRGSTAAITTNITGKTYVQYSIQ